MVEWFKSSAMAGGRILRLENLILSLRSGFETSWGRFVVSLFQNPISYGRLSGATLYVPSFGLRVNKLYPIFRFFFPNFKIMKRENVS